MDGSECAGAHLKEQMWVALARTEAPYWDL